MFRYIGTSRYDIQRYFHGIAGKQARHDMIYQQFDFSIYRNIRYDIRHCLNYMQDGQNTHNIIWYIECSMFDISEHLNTISNGIYTGWRAKHAQYDMIYLVSTVRCFDISEISMRYPSLFVPDGGKNTLDTIWYIGSSVFDISELSIPYPTLLKWYAGWRTKHAQYDMIYRMFDVSICRSFRYDVQHSL